MKRLLFNFMREVHFEWWQWNAPGNEISYLFWKGRKITVCPKWLSSVWLWVWSKLFPPFKMPEIPSVPWDAPTKGTPLAEMVELLEVARSKGEVLA